MIDPQTIQSALHARTELAFAAARATQLPGHFDAWKGAGLFATCVSDPEMAFLSTLVVTGTPGVDKLRNVLADQRWRGMVPGIVFWDEPAPPVDRLLRDTGCAVHGQRPVAVRALEQGDDVPDAPGGLLVEPVPDDALDEWVDVLLSAYEVRGAVARFIAAEHRAPGVQRFAIRSEGRMVAVAGMTLHGPVAVLGGAATLPAWRAKGAQAALLRHRLNVARETGCVQATATAAPDSPSARNLERSGFLVRLRSSWQTGSAST